ncbi:hypothetical protein [Lysobacter antibioticus]|jgi:hypothetical protein|uniref:Transmembrane protein n=1 Tax=Lysobacter antibioticus TaxID=84531 RepID=A0A0S2FEF8_LYSAN|nr:hypothetical protein [Lysobacter antibioticus]ALN81928.1 hypothetical protein LA76x_3807 [Lysobacter antibioticus]
MALDFLGEFVLREVFAAGLELAGKALRALSYWTGWALLFPMLRTRAPNHPLFVWAGSLFWLAFIAVFATAYWYLHPGT